MDKTEKKTLQQITVNQELRISFPSEFHVMNEEEQRNLAMLSEGESICLSAPELHIMISIGWKPAKGLLGKMLREEDLLRSMEKSISKAQKPYGFRLEENARRTIGEETAEGVRYTYTAQGINMCSESLVFKRNQTAYYFHIYFHEDMKQNSLEIWNQVLISAIWSDDTK